MADLRDAARALAGGFLGPVRRGPRTILWTPEITMGVGNHLYLWLWASTRQAHGEQALVLTRAGMREWLRAFPAITADLAIERAAVRITDRRLVDGCQGYGEHFDTDDLTRFIPPMVLNSPAFQQQLDRGPTDPERVVVNVRRGDYYADPLIRGRYGFDIDSYLRVALAETAAQGPISAIHVVSDGLDWCRARLGWLTDFGRLSFAGPSESPLENLVEVATARRLVLTNSTFSYWGGYISNVLHTDNHRQVVAPWFHARHIHGGRAFQLDPRWSIVRDIPGGWDG